MIVALVAIFVVTYLMFFWVLDIKYITSNILKELQDINKEIKKQNKECEQK